MNLLNNLILMEIKYLLLPGYGNSGPEHWQTYFEKNLPNCSRISQKSWEKPICHDWVSAINESLNLQNLENVVIITHSLGGIALAHWATKYQVKIKAAMIVAPPDLDSPWQDLGLESFTPLPNEKISFPTLIVASTNDNWTSVERAKNFAQNWGSELIFIGNAGHINPASGYGHWPDGLILLKNWLE